MCSRFFEHGLSLLRGIFTVYTNRPSRPASCALKCNARYADDACESRRGNVHDMAVNRLSHWDGELRRWEMAAIGRSGRLPSVAFSKHLLAGYGQLPRKFIAFILNGSLLPVSRSSTGEYAGDRCHTRGIRMKFVLGLLLSTLLLVCIGLSAEHSVGTASTKESPVILITGSNRGIGLALTNAYATAGWRVIATCRDPSQAGKLQELATRYRNVVVETLDVTNETSIATLVEKYRGQPIDVLVNNAGTSGGYAGQIPGQFDEATFQEIMRVNALSPLRISTALLDNVSASTQKKIIAISSGRGSVNKPFLERRAYFYDMSKAALNLGMRKLQNDVADKGVLIGIFAPGVVDTELNRELRNGVPATRKLISTEESAAGLVTLIAGLSRENQNRFQNYNGESFEW